MQENTTELFGGGSAGRPSVPVLHLGRLPGALAYTTSATATLMVTTIMSAHICLPFVLAAWAPIIPSFAKINDVEERTPLLPLDSVQLKWMGGREKHSRTPDTPLCRYSLLFASARSPFSMLLLLDHRPSSIFWRTSARTHLSGKHQFGRTGSWVILSTQHLRLTLLPPGILTVARLKPRFAQNRWNWLKSCHYSR